MNITRLMYCPICQTGLRQGEDECFKTLDDHVSNPNGEPPLRQTWKCPNPKCDANLKGCFWDV
jgi:hypothetical protein